MVHRFRRKIDCIYSEPIISILIINVTIYFALKILWLAQGESPSFLRIVNSLVTDNNFYFLFLQPWELVSYAFVHLDFIHLFVNMLWLICFGSVIKRTQGPQYIWGIYLTGSVSGALLFSMTSFYSASNEQLAGASASVMAIIGATIVLAPSYRIKIAGIGNFKVLYVAMIGILCLFNESSLSMSAHIAGLLSGLLYGLILRFWLMKTNLISSNAISSQKDGELINKARTLGYSSLSIDERASLFDLTNETK